MAADKITPAPSCGANSPCRGKGPARWRSAEKMGGTSGRRANIEALSPHLRLRTSAFRPPAPPHLPLPGLALHATLSTLFLKPSGGTPHVRVKFWGVRGSIPPPLSTDQLNDRL